MPGFHTRCCDARTSMYHSFPAISAREVDSPVETISGKLTSWRRATFSTSPFLTRPLMRLPPFVPWAELRIPLMPYTKLHECCCRAVFSSRWKCAHPHYSTRQSLSLESGGSGHSGISHLKTSCRRNPSSSSVASIEWSLGWVASVSFTLCKKASPSNPTEGPTSEEFHGIEERFLSLLPVLV